MREHLGWVTTCEDEHNCPQNWVELPGSELPATVRCHVCQRDVSCVADAASFEAGATGGELMAFPVVPSAGLGASYELDADGGGNGAYHGPSAPVSVPAPAPARRAAPKQQNLYVLLPDGQEYVVDKETMILGRSRTCEVVIPSAKVSRQHASITMMDGRYFIEDLGSANGVWKDGQRISDRMEITGGDSVTICEELIRFEMR